MLSSPTLLLNEGQCRKNIKAMAEKAQRNNVRFRPHFKTHQSIEIGRWFRDKGVESITVSSMKMAQYFATDQWQDVTVAFPVNIREIEAINQLAGTIQLNLTVCEPSTVVQLSKLLRHKVGTYIKIDAGYQRTGIPIQDHETINAVLKEVTQGDHMELKGFLTHSGHSYKATSRAEILDIHEQSIEQLNELRSHYVSTFPELEISVGDTPTCSLADDFSQVDEIRPGNFVFYDAMQWQLEACSFNQIAVVLACPVVAKHKDRNTIIVHGGAVHLSKEHLSDHFGYVVRLNENGWSHPMERAKVVSVSQEHGIIQCDQKAFDSIQAGDMIGIVPVHSCLTANLMGSYQTLDGKTIDTMLNTY